MKHNGPLSGIRILDFTHVLAGPFTTSILGDLGAEIIKIENPKGGDSTRLNGPPFQNGESAFFFCVNRNKKSICVDLKNPQAAPVIKKIVEKCDVVVENFRPGVMERLGIGYGELKKHRPDLIYASLNAFGAAGIYKDRPGFELIIQGLTGLVSITTPPGEKPAKIQIQIVDLCAGMFLAIAILSALYHRSKTGEGQQVETSLLRSTMAIMANYIGMFLMAGVVPKGMGTRNAQAMPSQAFETKDGYILVVAHANQWPKFCRAIDKQEWIDDDNMGKDSYRIENYDKVEALINGVLRTKETKDWLEIFRIHQVAAGPINTVEDLFSDPNVLESDLVVTMKHPKAGEVKLLAPPFILEKTPASVVLPPPLLGQHLNEILAETGFSEAEVTRLIENRVISACLRNRDGQSIKP